ncbi:hypothetical protein GSI_04581 [Ganoderma sinense ZZ0214-1]|uniref:Uncharacterized protein n=1 Tax=Ganoderma sinense ZZ0214-1 TaxID=1077348 RepID=A0A2G8SH94_9APHY|nr:hypothetical protein GSI_04581 [Ganoderma sinense ZZ0214-1]
MSDNFHNIPSYAIADTLPILPDLYHNLPPYHYSLHSLPSNLSWIYQHDSSLTLSQYLSVDAHPITIHIVGTIVHKHLTDAHTHLLSLEPASPTDLTTAYNIIRDNSPPRTFANSNSQTLLTPRFSTPRAIIDNLH